MVQFVIQKKQHFYDTSDLNRQLVINSDGAFESRTKQYDILECHEGTFYSDQHNFDHVSFAILQIDDITIEQANNFMQSLYRDVDISRTLNDDVNGVYEYRIDVINATLSGIGRFTDFDRFQNLPNDLQIISKTPTSVEFRLTTNNYDRKLKVEAAGKEIFQELQKMIIERRHRVDITKVPSDLKTAIQNNLPAITTKAIALTFITDKVGE